MDSCTCKQWESSCLYSWIKKGICFGSIQRKILSGTTDFLNVRILNPTSDIPGLCWTILANFKLIFSQSLFSPLPLLEFMLYRRGVGWKKRLRHDAVSFQVMIFLPQVIHISCSVIWKLHGCTKKTLRELWAGWHVFVSIYLRIHRHEKCIDSTCQKRGTCARHFLK